MAKKAAEVRTITQKHEDNFQAAFEAAKARAAAQQSEFDRKRDELRAEFASIVWRRARGGDSIQDASRLVEIAASDHLADLKIDREMFDRCVSVCQSWERHRSQFATVPQLQQERDMAHVRVRELQEQLRQAENQSAAAAGNLLMAHESESTLRSIGRQNPLLFDTPTGQPLDGTQLPLDMFVAQTAQQGSNQ